MSLTLLEIKAYGQQIFSDIPSAIITFQAVDVVGQPYVQEAIRLGTEDLGSTPYLTFASISDAITYYEMADRATLLDNVNTSIGFAYYTDSSLEFVDTPVNTMFAELADIAMSGSYSDLIDAPAIPTATSQLTNDSGFIVTSALSAYLTTSTASSTYVPKTVKVNGHALSGDVTVAYSDLTGAPTQVTLKAYEGTVLRTGAFPIFKSATVASGAAVFQLTSDGTSTGTALFPNGIIADSINAFVSDAAASYQMSYALTNSNKTLTITTNKLTTANILTGLLGQVAATGAVVHIQVWGY